MFVSTVIIGFTESKLFWQPLEDNAILNLEIQIRGRKPTLSSALGLIMKTSRLPGTKHIKRT